jgi:hypothetical protein
MHPGSLKIMHRREPHLDIMHPGKSLHNSHGDKTTLLYQMKMLPKIINQNLL